MRYATRIALVAVVLVVSPLPGRGAGPSPIHIPARGEPGWTISPPDDGGTPAPPGYEGRTDTSSETAVGDTDATRGKRIVARFQFGNKIKTCPTADGTAGGEGVFSMSVDSTDAQASGTSTIHIEMRANAKYKGQVGDDAYLDGPVNAEIDYTYDQSGTIRGPSGAIATSPPSHVEQHITIPFVVPPRAMAIPEFGAFSGGDPLAGHYGEALGTGMALEYWAGIYYSIAETKWRQGECAQVVFSPPGNSVQPALGTQTTVKAEVKTKGGESAKANLVTRLRPGDGTVDPGGGLSNVGAPLKFIYTAPDKKVPNPGFSVNATSRAGVAQGEWKTGLGNGWSGQIACMRANTGDAVNSELQTSSSSGVTRITIDVKNGVGTATGYAELSDVVISRRKGLRGGAIVLLPDYSTSTEGSAEGTSRATVGVNFNKADGTYSISAGLGSTIEGKQHSASCMRENCKESAPAPPFSVTSCFPNAMGGKSSDPNQLHGSTNDVKTNTGRSGKGTQTWTVTWDLGRQGSTQ
jgi:hypothetical protein